MSKKLILALIASGFIGFVLINLSLALRSYRLRASKHPEQPPFIRWWLKKYAIFLIVVTGAALAGVICVFFSYFDPFNPDLSRYKNYMSSANKHSMKKEYKEAAIELRNAMQIYPSDPIPHLGLARMLWAQGDLKGAKESFEQVIKLNPDNYDAHLELGRLLFITRGPEASAQEAQYAAKLRPKAAEHRLLLAEIALKTGKSDEAVTQYRAALTADPSNWVTREKLIRLLIARRSYAEASKEVGAGMLLSTKDTNLKIMLAQIQEGEGKPAAAEATLKAAAALDTVSPSPLIALGELLFRRREYVPALQSYEAALKRSPDNERIMNNIALLIADHGYELDRAGELASRLYTKHPKEPTIMDTMGWVLFKQGKLDQALPLLRSAAVGAPNNPEHRYHYGAALLKSGRITAGKKELEASLKISRNFDDAAKAQSLLTSSGK